MVGGGLGAVLYDKLFSTKVCKSRLKSCVSGEPKDTKELEITVEENDNNIKLLEPERTSWDRGNMMVTNLCKNMIFVDCRSKILRNVWRTMSIY